MALDTNPLMAAEDPEVVARGKRIIERLRKGDLPQMVDWFDPGLLAKVGVREVISSTLGSYTDQRLIQASTDNVSEERLTHRYNYSGVGTNTAGVEAVPSQALPGDAKGAVWIDYIADLGDGFEATYAMAYLLAADELKVAGESESLPAGQLLIMGGDQVYPDATKQEYSNRLRDPYDWAYATPDAKRKLFAIPGNHDWYDGLSAFSALFCSARDRISKGLGTQIGGWRCHQHRSYFAIQLPHNWWIWGPDIQLVDNLDDSQRDYFDMMADQTKKGDNIILCLAEPSWLHLNYDNMHEISMLARKNDAKICAIIAGDWHHYSRYTSEELGIQFITAGGGGAFAHATHGLKNRIALNWATPTGSVGTVASKADSDTFNRLEKATLGAAGRDFTMTQANIPAVTEAAPASVTPEPKPITDMEAGPAGIGRRTKTVRKEDIEARTKTYRCDVKSIYPPKSTSRLLCLKNLALPFRNRPFTYLVGLIYFIYAWAFVVADPHQSPITRNVAESINHELAIRFGEMQSIDTKIQRIDPTRASAGSSRPPGSTGAAGSQTNAPPQAISEKDATELRQLDIAKAVKQAEIHLLQKQHATVQGAVAAKATEDVLTGAQGLLKDLSDGKISFSGMVTAFIGSLLSSSLSLVFDLNALLTAAKQSPLFAFLLISLWAGLVSYVESTSRIVKVLIGTLHAAAHVAALLFVSWLAAVTGLVPWIVGMIPWVSDDLAHILWNVVVALFVGGLLGGFVMGLYWTLTSTFFNMHNGDAFGALGIKDYKNFLRIKLEPGRATIYPIALDRVPGPKGWRWQLNKGEQRPTHNPQILPVNPLKPRLIEKAPIVIEAAKVIK